MQAGRVPWGHGAHAPGVGVRWVSGGRPGEPSAAENVTLAPSCHRSDQSTARGSLASVRMGVPPTVAVLPAMPCVHVLGGSRAQSVRVHEAALPWASLCGGQHFTWRCTIVWVSAATEGPPSLAGAALGGPLVGPAWGPSPAPATLRAGGCLLCPVHVSAKKLDWVF